ncbi:hypothetical protein AKG34_00835 [Peribacillus butanolivorans]|uniref:hypothetical protein n=1 Tax=Peribacillus butanolivorans TaxID=421767 RepID=UPI0006A74ED4|nr:hypothetical protein [Peribacillus butanolivorans]KON67535.1 hypothetical protein AKG34_00835 [Peribacillus butanolivorans]
MKLKKGISGLETLWAHEKSSKGKVPLRANISGKRVVTGFKIGVGSLVNEINDLLTDTFQAVTNVFFKSNKNFKKKKVITKPHSLQDEIKANKISAATTER